MQGRRRATTRVRIKPHVHGDVELSGRREGFDMMVPVSGKQQRTALFHVDGHGPREAKEREALQVGCRRVAKGEVASLLVLILRLLLVENARSAPPQRAHGQAARVRGEAVERRGCD